MPGFIMITTGSDNQPRKTRINVDHIVTYERQSEAATNGPTLIYLTGNAKPTVALEKLDAIETMIMDSGSKVCGVRVAGG